MRDYSSDLDSKEDSNVFATIEGKKTRVLDFEIDDDGKVTRSEIISNLKPNEKEKAIKITHI